MLCVTLYAAPKSDRGFVSSKHKIRIKYKIHTTEIVQAGSDRVTARWWLLIRLRKKEMSNALCDTFKPQLKSDGGFVGSNHKGTCRRMKH
jgi:hypothetical protein